MAIDTSAWDEIQLDPLSPPPEDFDGMAVVDAVEVIHAWFLENFERPEESTPRDEGDWVYIWGGPYDGDDIIRDVFTDVASDEIIEAAIEAIHRHETEWVPNSRRIQPPDELDDPHQPGYEDDIKTLYRTMQARVRAVEQAVERLNAPTIGHNHPPELIDEATPLTTGDLRTLTATIRTLKVQPVEPATEPAEAIEAAGSMMSLSRKITAFILDKGDVFVTEAVKESAKWAIRLPLWTVLAKTLMDTAQAALAWVHALHPPF